MATNTAGPVSNDPNKGLGYILIGEVGKNGAISDMVQASGVMISPTEMLTAAHVVEGTGGLRTSGTVLVDYNKGSDLAVDAIAGVHVLSKADYSTDAGDATDYAIVTLKTPVTGATLYSLGSGGGVGTYTVSGYPAGTGGAIDTKAETLGMEGSYTLFKGVPLNEGTNNPHGSSGGPVWKTVNGQPVVYGDVSSMTGDGKTGLFKQLTAADVKQILAWEAQDKSALSTVVSSAPAVVAASPAPAATAASTSAKKTTDAPVTIGGASGFGDRLAMSVSDAAAAAAGPKQAMLSDVAAAITRAVKDGGDLDAMAQDAGQWIASGSSVPRRALAYLGGLLSSVTGGSPSSLFSDVNGTFAGAVSDGGTAAAAIAGFKQGSGAFDPSIAGLGDVIAQASLAGTSDAVAQAASDLPQILAVPSHLGRFAA